jgi:hypothetical protein
LAGEKKITHYFSTIKAKIVTTESAKFCVKERDSNAGSSGIPNSLFPAFFQSFDKFPLSQSKKSST